MIKNKFIFLTFVIFSTNCFSQIIFTNAESSCEIKKNKEKNEVKNAKINKIKWAIGITAGILVGITAAVVLNKKYEISDLKHRIFLEALNLKLTGFSNDRMHKDAKAEIKKSFNSLSMLGVSEDELERFLQEGGKNINWKNLKKTLD